MAEQEYKGFKYWNDGKNWWIRFPSGFKSILPDVSNEDDVRGRIDFINSGV